MKNPTCRDLRNAVLLAVALTAVAMMALLDPSCQHNRDSMRTGPSRSIAPH